MLKPDLESGLIHVKRNQTPHTKRSHWRLSRHVLPEFRIFDLMLLLKSYALFEIGRKIRCVIWGINP